LADNTSSQRGNLNTVYSGSQPTVTIQVSSFKARQDAEREVSRLKRLGISEAFIKYEAAKDKGMWYRVFVGRFDTQKQARIYAQALKNKGAITWSWVKTVMLPLPVTAAKTTRTSNTKAHQSTAPKPVQKAPPSTPSSERVTSSQTKDKPLSEVKIDDSQETNESDDSDESDDAERASPSFSFASQTTFRAFQRDTIKGEDSSVLPLYQFLGMDYGDSETGGWSFHAYGWGRWDSADSGYFDKSTDGDLIHGYLEYSKPYSAFRLYLGRRHIFSGVTNQLVDGMQLSTGLGESFTVLMYGGVTAASDDAGSDPTYGGRIALHPQPNYELGVSYQNTDIEVNPDERIGLDLFCNYSSWVTLQGLSSYNLKSEGWREHSYSATFRYKMLALAPSYQQFYYQDYFGTGDETNNRFRFLADTDEKLAILGADLQWAGESPFHFALRYNQYTYDLRQEKAAYYAALLSLESSEGSQVGTEIGKMDGETADNIYTLYRAYFYWRNPLSISHSAFISGDGIFQDYEVPVYGKDSATNYSLSIGTFLFGEHLELRLTGNYNLDPYFDKDVEGLFTLNYQY